MITSLKAVLLSSLYQQSTACSEIAGAGEGGQGKVPGHLRGFRGRDQEGSCGAPHHRLPAGVVNMDAGR